MLKVKIHVTVYSLLHQHRLTDKENI